MKKNLLTYLLILVFIGYANAKSDLQLTSPVISLFEKYDVSGEGVNCKGKNFFAYGNSLIKITNQNFIGDFKLGFYESIKLQTGSNIYLSNSNFGLQFSLGPVYKVLDKTNFAINCGLGPHFQIYEDGTVLGVEIDSQIKFCSNRRYSPVIGVTTNIDFYSTRNFYEYVWKTETQTVSSLSSSKFYSEINTVYYYEEMVAHEVNKYFHFYLIPYISFCVNLY